MDLVRKMPVTIAARSNLESEFNPAVNPFGFLLRDFQIIIGEPEPAEVNHAEKREPDELIVETRPEDARDNDGADHQHAAHGRRALFTPCSSASRWTSAAPRIGCPTFSAIRFSIMKFPKISVSQKRGDRRSNGAEGDIKKNVEPDELLTQVMEVVHHGEVTNAELLTAELLDHFAPCARRDCL